MTISLKNHFKEDDYIFYPTHLHLRDPFELNVEAQVIRDRLEDLERRNDRWKLGKWQHFMTFPPNLECPIPRVLAVFVAARLPLSEKPQVQEANPRWVSVSPPVRPGGGFPQKNKLWI